MQHRKRALALLDFLVVNAIVAVLVALFLPAVNQARGRQTSSACLSNEMRIGKACMAYVDDSDGTFPMNRLTVTGGTWTWKRAIFPYVKRYDTFKCPGVMNYFAVDPGTGAKGDDSNSLPAYRSDSTQWLPASYAYSGGFFFETVGGTTTRPRKRGEIDDPAHTLLVLNSRMSYPDLGPWMMSTYCDLKGNTTTTSHKFGPFVAHNGRIPVLFADGHVAAVKLIETIQPVDMWKSSQAGYQTQAQLLAIAQNMADEYK